MLSRPEEENDAIRSEEIHPSYRSIEFLFFFQFKLNGNITTQVGFFEVGLGLICSFTKELKKKKENYHERT